MTGSDDLTNRVWAASQQRSIDSDVRAMHLARIHGELQRPIHVAPTVTTTATMPMARRWRLAATAAALAILPATALTAANSALPGDHLYPTKRAVEHALTVIDDDVIASNRIEELEVLIRRQDRPEVVAAAQRNAEQEIRWLPSDHRLALRLNELFVGWGAGGYRLDRAVDWSEGDLFASSLPDGDLLWISRQAETETSTHYELSVSGQWKIERSDKGWRISKPNADPGTTGVTMFDVQVGEEGVLIVSVDDPGAPAESEPTPSSRPTTTTTPSRPGPPTTSPNASKLAQPTRPSTTIEPTTS